MTINVQKRLASLSLPPSSWRGLQECSDEHYPTVYIIMLNWNYWQGTIEGLESVFCLDYPSYRVVVCDNGSHDGSLDQIKAWATGDSDAVVQMQSPMHCNSYSLAPKPIPYVEYDQEQLEEGRGEDNASLVLIRIEDNLGFAGGANLGIKYALASSADFVFLMNNDARIAPDALRHLINVAQTADAAMVGAMVLSECGTKVLFAGRRWPDHMFGISRSYQVSPDPDFVRSYYAEGSAMLLQQDFLKRRFAETGHFLDPNLFMYCEDTDICLYGQSRGYRCVVAAHAVVYHGLSKSSGGAGNPHSYYYITRNRIFLAQRWLSFPWNVLFHFYYVPSRFLLKFVRMLRRQPSRWYAIQQGLIDGYQGVKGKWNTNRSPDVHL